MDIILITSILTLSIYLMLDMLFDLDITREVIIALVIFNIGGFIVNLVNLIL